MQWLYMYRFILQEDLISFIDFRTMKVKQEEQFKYEVCLKRIKVPWKRFAFFPSSVTGNPWTIYIITEHTYVMLLIITTIYMQVNEISWNKDNDQFFLTNGNGCVVIYRYYY